MEVCTLYRRIDKLKLADHCTAQTNRTPVCQGCGVGVFEHAGELSG